MGSWIIFLGQWDVIHQPIDLSEVPWFLKMVNYTSKQIWLMIWAHMEHIWVKTRLLPYGFQLMLVNYVRLALRDPLGTWCFITFIPEIVISNNTRVIITVRKSFTWQWNISMEHLHMIFQALNLYLHPFTNGFPIFYHGFPVILPIFRRGSKPSGFVAGFVTSRRPWLRKPPAATGTMGECVVGICSLQETNIAMEAMIRL